MTNISVKISLPYNTVFKYLGPTEQLSQVKELFTKWIGRASSVCFSNSKRIATPTQQPQGEKKPGLPAHKQPNVKQPPPPKVCKCTVYEEDFNSHSARKRHFNSIYKLVAMEVETSETSKKKRKVTHLTAVVNTTMLINVDIDNLNTDTVIGVIRSLGQDEPGNYLFYPNYRSKS
ncbi:175_t:CDS:2, partial [Acaulospora colombiana]